MGGLWTPMGARGFLCVKQRALLPDGDPDWAEGLGLPGVPLLGPPLRSSHCCNSSFLCVFIHTMTPMVQLHPRVTLPRPTRRRCAHHNNHSSPRRTSQAQHNTRLAACARSPSMHRSPLPPPFSSPPTSLPCREILAGSSNSGNFPVV
jgi:hypothetical protein